MFYQLTIIRIILRAYNYLYYKNFSSLLLYVFDDEVLFCNKTKNPLLIMKHFINQQSENENCNAFNEPYYANQSGIQSEVVKLIYLVYFFCKQLFYEGRSCPYITRQLYKAIELSRFNVCVCAHSCLGILFKIISLSLFCFCFKYTKYRCISMYLKRESLKKENRTTPSL